MCGIAGLLSLKEERPDAQRLYAMVGHLRHRGPDGFGVYTSGPVGLAHARLSIIDLEGGSQPIHNENRKVWVVFNGEIFNYVELRAELEARGHRFYTRSDTEVIVHLYEEKGTRFFEALNGQFAIALWDEARQSLLLGRDRVGIAPLHYARYGGDFLFASEAKSIIAARNEAPRLNLRALDQIFTFWAPVAPETLFEGIMEVPPGHWIQIRDGIVREGVYWDLTFPEHGDFRQDREADLAAELHDLLEDATRIRLRADVPVGAYLSGGLDSSVIAALVKRIRPNALRTFSIGFEESSLDEGGFQGEMAAHLGTAHQRFVCMHEAVGENIAPAVWHAETAMLRTAPAPMKMLSEKVREQGYKVVLTGEGADEILGGYDIFKEAKVRRFWAVQPSSRRRPGLLRRLYPYLDLSGSGQSYLQSFFGQGLHTPESPWFSHLPRWTTTARAKEFFSLHTAAALSDEVPALETLAAKLPEAFTRWHPFNRAQYLEVKLLMSGYLLSSQGDRMLMANGVEGRFPYLDHRVISFASAIHPRLKIKVLREKHLLRECMRPYLPSAISSRPKQPYRAPNIEAFAGKRAEILSVMEPPVLRDYGYFDETKVHLLAKKALAGRTVSHRDNMAFIGVLTTQTWHQHFIAGFHEILQKSDDHIRSLALMVNERKNAQCQPKT